MKRKLFKIGLGVTGFPAVVVVALLSVAQVRWDRTYDAPYPDIRASADSSVIARGRYLAYGPAHCAYCHTTIDKMPGIDRGEQPVLSGGHTFPLPFGTFYTPNLTPDAETGIGRRTDAELARTLRYGVRADGRVALPFMEFHNMSDDDLTAVISFLRSQPAIRNDVREHEVNALGKAILAFMIKPVGPEKTPPVHAPEGATIERGAYLANSVAGCVGCHTERNMMDGSYTGAPFSGGGVMPMDDNPDSVFVTPNLTPDPKTGRITQWTEDAFVARFRAGRVYAKSHMPWGPYNKMSDDDLRAIYRYLRSLPPVENETGPSLQKKS
jgi:mono/diheme cytochrome c family protein